MADEQPGSVAPTTNGTNHAATNQADAPRSLAITERGIKTGEDFANLMSALMADVISGRLNPNISNAAVNAGGKLLKVVEMQYRYGKEPLQRTLILASGE